MSKIVLRRDKPVAGVQREKSHFPARVDDLTVIEPVPEDEAFDRAIQRRRMSPLEAMQEIQIPRPPLVDGALVNLDTLRGFMEALAMIVDTPAGFREPTVKFRYEPATKPVLFIEGGNSKIWTAIAIVVEARSSQGFGALVPVQRAVNVLAAISRLETKIMVGVDQGGVCFGSVSVPFAGRVENFPPGEGIPVALSRSLVPGFYWSDISERILPACPTKVVTRDRIESAVLLEFDTELVGDELKPIAFAVATDGPRFHILRMPHIVVDKNADRLPPTTRLPRRFVEFLGRIAGKEESSFEADHAGIEVSERGVTVRGADFITTVECPLERRRRATDLGKWRGAWSKNPPAIVLSRERVLQALSECPAPDFTMSIDSINRRTRIESEAADGTRFSRELPGEAATRSVYGTFTMMTDFARDAVEACRGEVVRIAVSEKEGYGPAPVVFQGKDEDFRAVVISMNRGDL